MEIKTGGGKLLPGKERRVFVSDNE